MIHISAYKFVPLASLEQLRDTLREKCLTLNLKGTILLSTEGMNLTLTGEASSIDDFKMYIKKETHFADLVFKESQSEIEPYNRLLVKIKKEIITLNMPEALPTQKNTISPTQLKQWLDEKRDVVLFDVRNDYEVELGTFQNAVDLNLKHFSFLPEAVQHVDPQLKEKPVITFCTGGIRCEKAISVLMNQGFKEVYQLEGGILHYFEETDGAHYQGECFVFDRRIAVDKSLLTSVL